MVHTKSATIDCVADTKAVFLKAPACNCCDHADSWGHLASSPRSENKLSDSRDTTRNIRNAHARMPFALLPTYRQLSHSEERSLHPPLHPCVRCPAPYETPLNKSSNALPLQPECSKQLHFWRVCNRTPQSLILFM